MKQNEDHNQQRKDETAVMTSLVNKIVDADTTDRDARQQQLERRSTANKKMVELATTLSQRKQELKDVANDSEMK